MPSCWQPIHHIVVCKAHYTVRILSQMDLPSKMAQKDEDSQGILSNDFRKRHWILGLAVIHFQGEEFFH